MDTVTVKVNKLTSTKTQLPYEYYSLDYCKPAKIIDVAENLGEVLRGDRIENSPYQVCMWHRLLLLSEYFYLLSEVYRLSELSPVQYLVQMFHEHLRCWIFVSLFSHCRALSYFPSMNCPNQYTCKYIVSTI